MEQGKASILRDCARVEPQHEISQLAPCCPLTVKLRGRTTTPDQRRGRILTSHARGAGPPTVHGPLQRLLEAGTTTVWVLTRFISRDNEVESKGDTNRHTEDI